LGNNLVVFLEDGSKCTIYWTTTVGRGFTVKIDNF
jgi:hypothetical protein